MLNNPNWGLDEVGVALRKAGDYMKEHGHCKFEMWNNKGQVCLSGALSEVIGTTASPLYDECIQKMAEIQGIEGSNINKEMDLIDWNNAPERKGSEVIDLFRKAAELCRVTA